MMKLLPKRLKKPERIKGFYGMAKKALQTIDEYDIVTPSGYIVTICSHKEETPGNYRHFSRIVTKNYGQSLLLIYNKDG